MIQQNIKYKIKERRTKRPQINIDKLIDEIENESADGLLEVDNMIAYNYHFSYPTCNRSGLGYHILNTIASSGIACSK